MIEYFEHTLNVICPCNRVEILLEVLEPLSKVTHQIESCGTKSSWIYMLLSALIGDVDIWCRKPSTMRYFTGHTSRTVKKAVIDRWNGKGNKVGLQYSFHVLDWILDPYFTPSQSWLGRRM